MGERPSGSLPFSVSPLHTPMLDLSKVDFIADRANTSSPHQVAGKEREFWPLSTPRLIVFRPLAGKVAAALRDMTHDYTQESGAQTERNEQEKVGSKTLLSTVLPLSPALSEQHRKARMASVEALVAAFDDDVLTNLALCILDSMRDDFPRDKDKPFTKADAKALLDEMPFPTFVECCVGVFKANVDSFGLFAKKVGGKILRDLEQMTSSNSED